jgi:hypothetical protein
MSFFLTEDQEAFINEFLTRENTKICNQQLESEDIPEPFKELIRATIDTDSPVPFFNPGIGYYSISFTPIDKGNRIYIHHHLTNVSEPIYDPSRIDIINEDLEEELPMELNQPDMEEDLKILQQNSPIPIPETNEEFKENGYYIPSPD